MFPFETIIRLREFWNIAIDMWFCTLAMNILYLYLIWINPHGIPFLSTGYLTLSLPALSIYRITSISQHRDSTILKLEYSRHIRKKTRTFRVLHRLSSVNKESGVKWNKGPYLYIGWQNSPFALMNANQFVPRCLLLNSVSFLSKRWGANWSFGSVLWYGLPHFQVARKNHLKKHTTEIKKSYVFDKIYSPFHKIRGK